MELVAVGEVKLEEIEHFYEVEGERGKVGEFREGLLHYGEEFFVEGVDGFDVGED